jgi:cytochrome c biogenesis protein CcmG/thiol:disulfide interchange protein DsbE
MQPILRRILQVCLLVSGLVWIWFSRVTSNQVARDMIAAPQVGFMAPDFNLETISGDRVHLADLHDWPIIINFWASWCPPCRAEMPALQAVYDEYKDRVILLTINATIQDTLPELLSFQAEIGLRIPILLDPNGQVQHLYAITSLPTTFFISGGGIVRHVVIGGPMTESGLRVRVEELLEKNP